SRVLVDTSTSNVGEGNSIPFFHVPGMTGAGKKRQVAFHGANDQMVELLKQYKPSPTMNLVIFSLSGGSGSVLGPLLAEELIKRGYPTVCLIVGSIVSKIEAHNTNATLKTIETKAIASR